MSSLGINNGEPGNGAVGDVHIVLLVGGNGERNLAAGGGNLCGDIGHCGNLTFLKGDDLDVGLTLVVVGEDEDLAGNLCGFGLGLCSGNADEDVTVESVNLLDSGCDACGSAEYVYGNFVGLGSTFNLILDGDVVTSVCTYSGEVSFVVDLEGEVLLLGDLDLGLTNNQDNVVIGRIFLIDVGKPRGFQVSPLS